MVDVVSEHSGCRQFNDLNGGKIGEDWHCRRACHAGFRLVRGADKGIDGHHAVDVHEVGVGLSIFKLKLS